MYAGDHDDQLVLTAFPDRIGPGPWQSWVTGLLGWDLSKDNINTLDLIGTNALLGRYTSRATGIYRCPALLLPTAIRKSRNGSTLLQSSLCGSTIFGRVAIL